MVGRWTHVVFDDVGRVRRHDDGRRKVPVFGTQLIADRVEEGVEKDALAGVHGHGVVLAHAFDGRVVGADGHDKLHQRVHGAV